MRTSPFTHHSLKGPAAFAYAHASVSVISVRIRPARLPALEPGEKGVESFMSPLRPLTVVGPGRDVIGLLENSSFLLAPGRDRVLANRSRHDGSVPFKIRKVVLDDKIYRKSSVSLIGV